MLEAELTRMIGKQPIIVWLGYNIHGDEAAGTEAAMRVLYELLDGNSKALKVLWDEVVVIMNPCQNPDRRERFVVWANAHGMGRPKRFAYEKENPWNVQGRYNYYYFDLNRDMIAMSQVESRNSGAAFQEWLPQAAADHHGETKEFFFPPRRHCRSTRTYPAQKRSVGWRRLGRGTPPLLMGRAGCIM